MGYVTPDAFQQSPFVVGKSKAMMQVYELTRKVAPSDVNVLIFGESGTGKELIARALHHYSSRSGNPFVAVNCAALPENLVESELFGHERGAFTGAITQRIGKFERAQGGTILLDEIGEMPLPAQAKTLRVLQEKELERVGGSRPIKLNVRVVSSTNRDIERAVREGSFREDLSYRLKVIMIHVPPLRERRDDIPFLTQHFLKKYASLAGRAMKLSKEAFDSLHDYSYPGNVRELENIIQRGVILAEGDHITLRELPSQVTGIENIKESDSDCRIARDALLKALREVTISKKGCSPKNWSATLRSVTIENIHNFLLYTNGEEFSRQEFANFLSLHARNDRNKYGTVGRYLRVLKDNHITVHNAKKATEARHRLCEAFIIGA